VFKQASEDLVRLHKGFMTSIKSKLSEKITPCLLQLEEYGIQAKIVNQFLYERAKPERQAHSTTITASIVLTLNHLAPMFILLVIGLTLAILAFIVELSLKKGRKVIWHRFTRKFLSEVHSANRHTLSYAEAFTNNYMK